MSRDGWVAIDGDDLEALQRKGWLPVGTGPGKLADEPGPVRRREPTNGRALTNGREGPNGTGLTSGPGMVNGLGFTAWRDVEDLGPTRSPHPMLEEFVIVDDEGPPTGMELRKDLINGFSIMRPDPPLDPKATWGVRSWNRRVAMRRMRELAAKPLPGEDPG